jgi:hypothetical protein
LTPLEISFSLSDVGNKEKHKEEESKRKVVETISLIIGTPECPKNVKIGAQCSDEENLKFTELLSEFLDFFIGLIGIFVVLIMLLYNMPFLLRRT